MSHETALVLEKALALEAIDRAIVVESLLASLDRPDPAIDALWVAEVRRRLEAYDKGEMDSFDADEVFAELGITP